MVGSAHLVMSFAPPRLGPYVPVGVIVAVYLGLSCAFLDLPGLQEDETLFALPALGGRGAASVVYTWHLFGVTIPVMVMAYLGATKAWLFTPIFAAFGSGPWAVRLPVIVLGAVTLICLERWARDLFGRRVSLLATALLAVDTSYIISVRIDFGPVAIMLATKMASLLCLASFAKHERTWWLFAGMFLMGLGLFDKFNFVWHIAAAGAAALVVWPNGIRRLITMKRVAVATLAFLLGAWPVLLYNIVTRGGTFASVQPPSSIASAVALKLADIRLTLEGVAFPIFMLGAPTGSPTWQLWALLLSLPLGFAARHHLARRAFAFGWLMIVFVIAAIIATPMPTGPHHAMMLWPFPHVVVAAAWVAAWEAARHNKAHWLSAATATVAGIGLVVTSVVLTVQVLVAFHTTGGRGNFSDAIYALAERAAADREHRYLIMDWGIGNPLTVLARERVLTEAAYWSFLDPAADGVVEWLYRRALDPKTRFVFKATEYTTFAQPRQQFDDMLHRYGLREEIVDRSYGRDGKEVHRVVAVHLGATPPALEDLPAWSIRTTRGSLTAQPREPRCNERGLGILSLSWEAPGIGHTELHVASPTGPLLAAGGESGSSLTGPWVTPGMTFYLQDVTDGHSLSPEHTIARLSPPTVCP